MLGKFVRCILLTGVGNTMRNFDTCMAEIIALIHEAREFTRARGEDAVGWEIILGMIAAEVEASRQRYYEREQREETYE
jgi:hypothetical protein